MKYYILNIIEEINEERINTVDDWMLKGLAPIFFGNTNVDEIIKKENQKMLFFFVQKVKKRIG